MSRPVIELDTVAATSSLLEKHNYIPDIGLSTSLFLALKMGKAIFLEGEPGVGKTEVAKVLSQAFNAELIRLQCYEGLDESKALYEWKYGKQLLYTQVLKEQLGDILKGARGLAPTVTSGQL